VLAGLYGGFMVKCTRNARSLSIALIVGVLSLLSLFPLAHSAQAQSTAAGIVGTITDGTGAVLPGVTVTASGPALQVPQVLSVTDENGQYRLSPLPVGTYTVTYELAGFQTLKREGVQLQVGFVAKLDQALNPGAVQETVTVTGESPTVDLTNPAHSVNLSVEQLESEEQAAPAPVLRVEQAPRATATDCDWS